MTGFWSDLVTLFTEQPLLLEGLLVLLLFVFALLLFRRIRLIAEELERRKALGEYIKGLDEFLRADYRDAIKTLEKVLERDPENVEGRIALGDCYREVGDPAEAKKHHHHVHRVFGHELARNFLSLGRDELALHNYDRSVEAFQRAAELKPRDPEALAGLAQANAEGGNPIAAAQHLRDLYPDGPKEGMRSAERREAARRFTEAGTASLAEGNAEGAVRFFTEALAFQPESFRARTGIVRAAHELGDESKARELVEKHVAELKQLAGKAEVLFETSGAGPQREPHADAEQSASLLPARLEDVGGVVRAVAQKTARYCCSQCGMLLRAYAEVCPGCESVGTVAGLPEIAAVYTRPLPGFRAAMAEVEGSSAYLQSLAHKASSGDEEAMKRLLDQGPSVIYEVFAALPHIEARRYLGSRMAALGREAAREVRQCHAVSMVGTGCDEFAAAYYLSLDAADADKLVPSLGPGRDAAVAGVLADPRLSDDVRDAAMRRLKERGYRALVPLVEAVAASGDFAGSERAAALVREWGEGARDQLERRYLQATLLGKIFRGARGDRRRAAADILSRSGLPGSGDALGRAAAREKDPDLRAHYVRAKERAEKGEAAAS
ncbi:MAG: tetratricopeptide repeat protein [Planctomycetota bacterium]